VELNRYLIIEILRKKTKILLLILLLRKEGATISSYEEKLSLQGKEE